MKLVCRQTISILIINIIDGANLRSVMEIRYWNVEDQGFSKLPEHGMLDIQNCISKKDETVEIQVISSINLIDIDIRC
jgi:hypothetical protein